MKLELKNNHADSFIRYKQVTKCMAIRREFELIGPTLLKYPLGVRWGLAYLAVDGFLASYLP